MLTPTDFISLPYTPDLTLGGIAYACRSLSFTYNRMGGTPFARLRRIVAGKAAELAFRRYLTARQVPFDTLGATPFTEPDRYDVALGGRRVDMKTFLILKRDTIRQLRQDPSVLMKASALVPVDQIDTEHLRDGDIFLFAFVAGLTAETQTEIIQAKSAGQPVYSLYSFPRDWSRPAEWDGLGELALKSEADFPIQVEAGGQGENRLFISEDVTLQPGQRIVLQHHFFALAYFHVDEIPPARVGIHSTRLHKTHLIQPAEWGNIWVYGMQIILCGYLTCADFRRSASFLPAGSQVWQYPRTRTRNLALPLDKLRPINDLLERTMEWENSRRKK